jgi:hypothetical protein
MKALYADQGPLIHTADAGGSTTSIIDDDVLEYSPLSGQEIVGAYVYSNTVAAPLWAQISAYDEDTGTLTLSPALGGDPSSAEYEMHYWIHPERINELISQYGRIASNGAIDAFTDETTAQSIDKFVIAQGVLSELYKVVARMFPEARVEYGALADQAQADFNQGVRDSGYIPWMGEVEETEPQSLRRP